MCISLIEYAVARGSVGVTDTRDPRSVCRQVARRCFELVALAGMVPHQTHAFASVYTDTLNSGPSVVMSSGTSSMTPDTVRFRLKWIVIACALDTDAEGDHKSSIHALPRSQLVAHGEIVTVVPLVCARLNMRGAMPLHSRKLKVKLMPSLRSERLSSVRSPLQPGASWYGMCDSAGHCTICVPVSTNPGAVRQTLLKLSRTWCTPQLCASARAASTSMNVSTVCRCMGVCILFFIT
jgi:hypothetical protein